MGADLIMSYLWIEEGQKLNWKAGKEKIKTLVKKWKKAGKLPGPIDYLDIEVVQDYLTGALDDVMEGVNERRRDMTWIEIPPIKLFVTGGMSWGDSPTELNNSISDLQNASTDILEACGFYPKVVNWKDVILKILENTAILPLLIGIDKNLDDLVAPKLKGAGK